MSGPYQKSNSWNARRNALLAAREPKGMVTADILDRQRGGLGVDAPAWAAKQRIVLDLANINLFRGGALPVPPLLTDYVL